MNEMKEIPGYPLVFAGDDGHIYSAIRGGLRRLAERDNGRGYMRAQVGGRPRAVHRLVMVTFHGPRPEGMEVNHKDGDKLNNRQDNLEYTTRSKNMKHAFANGLAFARRGSSNFRAKLTEAEVHRLRQMRADLGKLPPGEINACAARCGVTRSAVLSAVAGRRAWVHS